MSAKVKIEPVDRDDDQLSAMEEDSLDLSIKDDLENSNLAKNEKKRLRDTNIGEEEGDEEEEEYLNIDNVNKKVWLVKVPTFIAERWNAINEEGVDLGRIRIFNE